MAKNLKTLKSKNTTPSLKKVFQDHAASYYEDKLVAELLPSLVDYCKECVENDKEITVEDLCDHFDITPAPEEAKKTAGRGAVMLKSGAGTTARAPAKKTEISAEEFATYTEMHDDTWDYNWSDSGCQRFFTNGKKKNKFCDNEVEDYAVPFCSACSLLTTQSKIIASFCEGELDAEKYFELKKKACQDKAKKMLELKPGQTVRNQKTPAKNAPASGKSKPTVRKYSHDIGDFEASELGWVKLDTFGFVFDYETHKVQGLSTTFGAKAKAPTVADKARFKTLAEKYGIFEEDEEEEEKPKKKLIPKKETQARSIRKKPTLDEEDEEDEVKPSPKTKVISKPGSKKKVVEEESLSASEEEEEVKPKKPAGKQVAKKPVTTKKKVVEDSDEEEEEVKPKKPVGKQVVKKPVTTSSSSSEEEQDKEESSSSEEEEIAKPPVKPVTKKPVVNEESSSSSSSSEEVEENKDTVLDMEEESE